jgi:hypothetical protein
MANWSNPTLTSTYVNFLSEMKDRDVDLALQFDGTTSTNLSVGTVRWDSSANRWKKWTGSAWGELAATYALTALSTTGAATIGTTLGVTGAATLSGGGTSTTPATADNSTAIATTAFVKAQAYAPLASPSLTGTPLAPTAATSTNTTQIATTAFTVAQIANDALLKSGGTMTGPIVLSGDPTAENNPTTKHWVESRAFKDSCRVATTGPLTVTATTTTLTNAGTLASISIDSISLSSGDRVLVKDQATAAQNGIYTVTTVGSGAVAWVLTRGTDTDIWNDLVAAVTAVEQGTANDNTMWLSTTALGGTLGSTAVTWIQILTNAGTTAINVPNGTAAAPAISFLSSGGDTGLYSPGTDQVAISTGGTGRVFVDASGNVFIGAAAAVANSKFLVAGVTGGTPLTVQGASGNSAALAFYNNAAITDRFVIGQGYASGSDNIAFIQNNANAALVLGTNFTERFRIDNAGKVGIGTTPTVALDVVATDAVRVASGTTAQRPTGAAGMIRYNSQLGQFEGYGSAWGTIGGGAKGGGSDQVFFENDQTVSTSYSITAGKNAVTAGPVTVASGVTVTIPSGSTWSIV